MNWHIVNPWGILVFVLVLIVCVVANDINSLRIHEICQSYTGRRIYLESNERGFIQASNISNAYYKNVRLLQTHFISHSKQLLLQNSTG